MLTDKEKFLIAAHDGQVEDKVYITGRLVKAMIEIKRLRSALTNSNGAIGGYLTMAYSASEATAMFRGVYETNKAALEQTTPSEKI